MTAGAPVALEQWEMVVGLEVHVQLKTRTKLFCACSAEYGAPPNASTCPVCLALPGALPVLNGHAVALATRAALALNCVVPPVSVFARKNYFYPDLPKGYQISQFDKPLALGGWIEIGRREEGDPVRIGVTRVHMEDDAGKSIHDRFPGVTAIDLNRSGVPLIEIVSEPDMRSAQQAGAYLIALRQILLYTGASDCSMEQGSLRVDANLSIRRVGDEALGTKTEVKNMNSFANVERALEAERARQIALMESGRPVRQVTLLFDAATGAVRPTRSKEESHDYRYFPDPDLPPLVLDQAWEDQQRAALPELPEARRERFSAVLGLTPYHAGVVASDRELADYFEAVVAAGADPKAAANWVVGDVMTGYNETGALVIPPARLAELIGLERDGIVSLQAARRIFAELGAADGDPRGIAERLGLIQVKDQDALAGWVDAVLAAHPSELARYRAGETKLMGFFVGQVMKQSGGKADPKGVQPLLRERLG
jgi:aspartyl-tRNA(Asn)/glutamyl-tRNA(Gln) amidotransferase subunit B